MELKTPLYDTHVEMGAKIVPFGGFLMPVQYSGVIAEHMAVRTACGLFDVSHMGEVTLKGADALKNVNNLLTNNFEGMEDGQARYGMMCLENGGIIDDLIVYKMSDVEYLLVVNASNTDKDFKWIADHVFGDCVAENVSAAWGQVALQGPKAEEILRRLTPAEQIPEKNYTFVAEGKVGDIACIVSRTGYTGEDGFELYCAADDVVALWKLLLKEGEADGLIPCGLGARDTLRLEAAMPLYGHELTEEINPYQAVLGIFCKLDKEDFIGKAALVEAKANLKMRRVGLKITGRGIAREHCDVYVGDEKIGFVSSGTHCPYIGGAIAMAYVPVEYKEPGTAVEIDVRGRRVAAEVIKTPFYKRAN